MAGGGEDGGERADVFEAQNAACLDGGLVDGGDFECGVLRGAGRIGEEALGLWEVGGEGCGNEAYKDTAEVVHGGYLGVIIGGRARKNTMVVKENDAWTVRYD